MKDLYLATSYTSGISTKELSEVSNTIKAQSSNPSFSIGYYIKGQVYTKPFDNYKQCILLIKDDNKGKITSNVEIEQLNKQKNLNLTLTHYGGNITIKMQYTIIVIGKGIASEISSFRNKNKPVAVYDVKTNTFYVVEAIYADDPNNYQTGYRLVVRQTVDGLPLRMLHNIEELLEWGSAYNSNCIIEDISFDETEDDEDILLLLR